MIYELHYLSSNCVLACSQQHGPLPAAARHANMSGKAGGEGPAMEREREIYGIQETNGEQKFTWLNLITAENPEK